MAIGETPITVLGTVISDVTLKRVGSNENALATFLIRSTERKWDKEKGTWADHRHFTVRVKCWRKLAVTVASTLTKGDPVIVAAETVSFCGMKAGFTQAKKFTGKVTVGDIGAPRALLEALRVVERHAREPATVGSSSPSKG